MRISTRLAGLALAVVGLVAQSSAPAGAAATPPTNSDNISSNAKAAGSDTTYFVLNDLALAFNESQGCESYTTIYGAAPDLEPQRQECSAAAGQPNDTVTTENYDHDNIVNYFPRGSSDGFRQLCRREATSPQNIQFARSSSSASVQASNCTTANGGDAGTVFRWVSFAKEALTWAYWTGGHATTNLSVQELKDIYVNCALTHWNQVGTGPAYIAPAGEPIRVFTPIATSGSRQSWDTFLGGSSDNCIPVVFKDALTTNGNRVIREHQAIDVEVIDLAAEGLGLNGPDGIPGNGDGGCTDLPQTGANAGCATADNEDWSNYGGTSCAVLSSQAANRSTSNLGDVDANNCTSATHPFARNMYNVFANVAPTGYPGTSPATRRFTDLRPAFPPGNATVNGYLCMPLNQHSTPVALSPPGKINAAASKNYGLEKLNILQTQNGFSLHIDDAAYQPGGVTVREDKTFCKMAEWQVNTTGNMTFTGVNLGLPSGA